MFKIINLCNKIHTSQEKLITKHWLNQLIVITNENANF